VGQGYLSAALLARGWRGVGFELDAESAVAAQSANEQAISEGRYEVRNDDWLAARGVPTADLILSSMVLEHLDDAGEHAYLNKCRAHLSSGGRCVLLVPGSPRDWGVEDDIAGHYRRYTYDTLRRLAEGNGWRVEHMAGLTYPLSNLLLPISNRLVTHAEHDRGALSMTDRTKYSGRRHVPGKTHFPAVVVLLLNEWTLYPFHLMQKIFSRASRSLVIYAEFAAQR
jgi:SAM-dependent methyltransferase